ncbi:MAG TPA: hypothetical protein VL048_07295 [Xanthobacteraceae bacterium]|nr:hypothetical protein [Xanthobacteraceae bacterium]
MGGLFKSSGLAGSNAPEGPRLGIADSGQNFGLRPQINGRVGTVVKFPKRPDLSVLSETIPLFYIARNKHGFWVAREAEGRRGGVFLLRRSAVRFARQQSAPVGCAMMFLSDALELDIENAGSRVVEPVTAFIDAIARRVPKLAAFVALSIAEWRKLVAQLSRALAGERRNRDALERELFRSQYTLSSKNDDDLPVP